MDVVLGFEFLVAEVQVLQRGDRAGLSPRVFPVSFAAVSPRPGAVEILQGHVRHVQGKDLLDLAAQVGIGGVIGERDHRHHVLHVVLGRIVLVVAVDGRPVDHARIQRVASARLASADRPFHMQVASGHRSAASRLPT